MLNELRHKADQAAVDQLCKRTQVVTDTASTMSLTQKHLESRMIAVEKRLEYEFAAGSGDSRNQAANQPLGNAVNPPADTNTSCATLPSICDDSVADLHDGECFRVLRQPCACLFVKASMSPVVSS